MPVSIVIVDDHELVRLGLRNMLHGSEMSVVGDAADAKQAVDLIGKLKPNVALIDVRMPKQDGFWVLDQVRKKSPKTAVVMMSAFDSPNFVVNSFEHGAVDFLDKGAPRHEVVYAVHRAHTGTGDAVASTGRSARMKMGKRRSRTDNAPLTNRELDVVKLIAKGKTNREIAEKLEISIETVKEHVQHLLRRLQLESRTQAALWAIKEGLVDS